MFLYVLMALYAGVGWAFNARLGSMMATAIAPTGAIFTFISLVTGSLWGRPAWGVWWVWDARLTSTLILMFLYIGLFRCNRRLMMCGAPDRAGAVLAVVGVINVPIIYFSVQWWNSLHQGATITARSFRMAPSMRSAMLIMVGACWLYSIAVCLVRVRHIIREREQEAPWLTESAA
jgi:heme exporter protein C